MLDCKRLKRCQKCFPERIDLLCSALHDDDDEEEEVKKERKRKIAFEDREVVGERNESYLSSRLSFMKFLKWDRNTSTNYIFFYTHLDNTFFLMMYDHYKSISLKITSV